MADIKVNVFMISRSFKALQQSAYAPIRKSTGLGQMELQIIFTVFHFPVPATISGIHRHTYFNKGQISVCVSNLLKGGFLKKVPNGNSCFDAFELTEKGVETAKRIAKNTARGRKKLLKGFTDEEAAILTDYLERIMKNAEKYNGKIKFD